MALLRWYEGLWLFDSIVASKDMEACLTHVKTILEKHGAKIHKVEKWDDRKLAYEVKKVKRGTYIVGFFEGDPTTIPQLKRDFQLSETVLRHLLLQDDKLMLHIDERARVKKKREAEAAQAMAEGLPVEGERGERRGGYRDGGYRDRDSGGGGGGGGGYRRREERVSAPSNMGGEA